MVNMLLCKYALCALKDIHRLFRVMLGLDVVLVMLGHSIQCLTAAVCLAPSHTDLQ